MSSINLKITVDNKDANKGLDSSKKKLTSFQKEWQKLAKVGASSTASLGQKIVALGEKYKSSFSGIGGAAKKAFSGIATVAKVGLGALVAGLGLAAGAVIGLARDMSKLNKQLNRVSRYGEEGKVAFDQIAEFASTAGISLDAARESGANLLSAFKPDAAVELYKVLSDIGTMGGGDVGELANMMTEFSGKSILAAGDIEAFAKASGISIQELTANMASATGKSMNAVSRDIAKGALNVDDLLKGLQGLNGTKASGTIALEAAKEDPGAALQRISNQFQKFREQLAAKLFTDKNMEQIQVFVDFISANIPAAIDTVVASFTWMSDSWASVSNFFTKNAKIIKATVGGLVAGLLAAATTVAVVMGPMMLAGFSAWAAGAAAAAAATIAATWPVLALLAVVALVVGLIIYYWDDIVAATKKAWDMVIDSVEAVIQWFEDLDFGKIADDIMDGLINGIKNGAGMFKDAMKNMAKSGIDAFKSLFGIASPSKLFKQFGEFTTEGFVIGVKEGSSDVNNALGEMVNFSTVGSAAAGGDGIMGSANNSSSNTSSIVFNFNGTPGSAPDGWDVDRVVEALNSALFQMNRQGIGY